MISQISIRNFRSIEAADISLNRITSFVGANDAGKSNVLRALNLFFNGKTDAGEDFAFSRDFNQFAETPKQKAKQIEVKIRFLLPQSYRRSEFPPEVEWRKVWRQEGQVTRMETRSYVGGAEFPSRSKVPSLLDRLHYTYIPAIKDAAFFSDLQGRLYDVLSTVAEGPLKESAQSFESQLGDQLRDLLSSISAAFGDSASMRLPENLREIFENLEISSGAIPLSRRGDGIKIRHIPTILAFIADKRDELFTRGGVRYTHLWGFEEPENNVELLAAFKMAADMAGRIFSRDNSQLFLTTHSPVFYRLDEHQPEHEILVSTHFVEKKGNATAIEPRPAAEVDENMGLMPLVAPYIAEAKAKFDAIQTRLARASDLAAQRVPTLFVEGESDRIVLTKAWSLFSGRATDTINIDDGGVDAYGGANALTSRSIAWLLAMKHRATADRVRAIALYDNDEAGRQAKSDLRDTLGRLGMLNLPHFKTRFPEIPDSLKAVAQAGFKVRIDLEALFFDAIWERANERSWISPVENVSSLLSPDMVQRMVDGGESPFSGLEAAVTLRLRNTFTSDGKLKAAKYLATLGDVAARAALASFEPMVLKVAVDLGFAGAEA